MLQFWAHLSWKLKWVFLIAFLPSSVCLSVRPSVNFSYFWLLLQNHWANFNQTWHKASLSEWDLIFFKEEPFNSHKDKNGVFFLLLINALILSYVFIDLNCFLRWAMWPMGLLLIHNSFIEALVIYVFTENILNLVVQASSLTVYMWTAFIGKSETYSALEVV